MGRLPGDPGPLRQVRYALGFRLPSDNRDWVWHDLTDAGWRTRLVVRHLVLMIPICLALGLLPGPLWLRGAVALLALLTSTFTVVVSAEDLRRSRLHRHGFDPPPGERQH
ncbi:DUF5313 family protein [Actinomadura rupiterrae]|uniref:DUF5313 family protein n=1 Tax=Actinomadura rupiterrae TaxID=559627 RepID=UPI0020A3F25C|nr:DUF5313 family protein [Actinomadura rupiterrae]MCP2335453.1 hypothetical protein [Actinomadura rupiterrae]